MLPQQENSGNAPISTRLNELDVTESVCVTDPISVSHEVLSLFNATFPGYETHSLKAAFTLFAQVYQGKLPGYLPCDTIYHDIQHSLDITLTTTRLLRGYYNIHRNLDARRMILGIVTALFHDVGYIRMADDKQKENGAEYTATHVSRGAEFMEKFFPLLGLQDLIAPACTIVHLTGYEKQLSEIVTLDTLDRQVGDIVATADLITQMADRCYLEKCRDRLFPELALATMGLPETTHLPRYPSATALLYNTPAFYRLTVKKRLENDFKGAYKFAGAFFNGPNLYIEKLEKNIRYLEQLIKMENFHLSLRRQLPYNYGSTVFPFTKIVQLAKISRAGDKQHATHGS